MKRIWKNENREYHYLQLGILAALMTYHTETLMSFGVISTLTMFHLFLGVGASAIIPQHTSDPAKYHIVLRKWKYPAVALLIIFIIAIFQFSYRQYKAEYYFRQAKNRYIDENWEQFWKDSNAAIEAMPYEYVYYSDFAEGILTATAETGVRDLSVLEDNLTQVLHLFEKALKIGYSQPYIHANLGLTYFTIADVYKQLNQTAKSQEMIDNGIAEYELAMILGPNNPLYSYNLGISLFKLKNYEKAVPYFQETLEIRDPFNDSFYYLAASYVELGQIDEAKKWNEKELAIHPESEDAKKLLEGMNSQIAPAI
jgi:tetratricopeptide (TPR) repeat protein